MGPFLQGCKLFALWVAWASAKACGKFLLYWDCCRQLDRHVQSRKVGPDAKGHQGREPWVPSNRQNDKPLQDHSLKH